MLFGKKVGTLRDDITFVTFRHPDKHFFIKYQGYGMSTCLIDTLTKKGCKKVVIIEQQADGSQRKLETELEKFRTLGKYHKDNKADYQRILPLSHFRFNPINEAPDSKSDFGVTHQGFAESVDTSF